MNTTKTSTTRRGLRSTLAKVGAVTGIVLMLGMTSAPAHAKDNNDSTRIGITEALENSANHILQAYVDGELPEGTTLDEVQEIVPEAFRVDPGMRMGMVYMPEYPSYFSLCGWTADNSVPMDQAVAFKSVTGTASPMAIDCTNSEGAVNPAVVDVQETGTVNKDRPEGLDFPAVDTVGGEDTPAAYQAPAPAPEPAKPAEPAEPINMQPIIIGGSILLGIAVLVGIIFMTYFLSRKVRLNTQQSSLNSTQWNELVTRCDDIVKKWADYELDPAKILDFPLLSDMREELTRQFHSALRRAKHLRPENINKVKGLPALGSSFAKAVDDLESAFMAAETEAKRIRWNHFSPDERKRLRRAKDLLDIALNEGASENERQSAYKRMQKELEGLIVVPEATVLTLVEKINLQITDGTDAVRV